MIIFLCPDIVTGGPESIHFLCNKLIQNGLNSSIYYINDNGSCKKAFYKYNCPIINDIVDIDSNFLIVPETLLFEISNYKRIKILVFWLSLEYAIHSSNYIFFFYRYLDYLIKPKNYFSNNKLKSNFSIKLKDLTNFYNLNSYVFGHLCNSHFAYNYCTNHYNNVKLLRIPNEVNSIIKKRTIKENIILYNPKKKPLYTLFLKLFGINLKFIPISNLNKDQVYNLMSKSKIFLDFGNHPGRERMPREAALLDCIIITNKCGSANCDDLPIKNIYKFDENYLNIFTILKFIYKSLNEYDLMIYDFKDYKESLVNEYQNFDEHLASNLNIFK